METLPISGIITAAGSFCAKTLPWTLQRTGFRGPQVTGVIEEEDNVPELGFHMPFVPSLAAPLADFLRARA